MPSLRFMSWNIQVYGGNKAEATKGGAQLIEVIASVAHQYNIDAVAICEIRADWGWSVGQDLAAAMKKKTTDDWDNEPSVKFIAGFWEQYLWVWNKSKLKLYGTEGVQWEFFKTVGTKQVKVGFPAQMNTNRQPFMAWFESVSAPALQMPVAMFHAPNPSQFTDIKSAFKNMATAEPYKTRTTEAVAVMGDFNIKAVANSLVAGSNGRATFQPMLNVGYTQLIPGAGTNDVLTSLTTAAQASKVTASKPGYSEPYDTILFRPPAAPAPGTAGPTNVNITNAGRIDVIADGMGAGYLGPSLKALHKAKDKKGAPTGQYTTRSSAFLAYRKYVSDHVPVIMQVNWT